MLKSVSIFMFTCLVVLLVSCDNKDVELGNSTNLTSSIKVGDKPALLFRKNTALDANNNLVFLYQKGSQLYIHLNQKEILIDKKVQSKRHHWLSVSGEYVYVFWWEKFGKSLDAKPINLDKTLYVRASSDGGKTFGKKIIINSSKGRPLAKLSIASDEKGNASVFYLDERLPVFEVFINSTHDGGKTWSKDLMLNNDELNVFNIAENTSSQKKYFAVSPSINRVGKELVAIWQEASKENGKPINRVVSRTSVDQGRTWGKKKELYIDKDNYSLQLKTFSKAGRLFVVVTQAGKGLYVIYKNEGADWLKPSVLAPGTDKAKSASYIAMDADDKYFYVTYIRIPPNGGKKDWATVLQRYNLKEKTWDKPLHRFDAITGEEKTRGGYQDFTILDDGTLVAVWEDYRYILPVILMSYSLDQGDNWSAPFILDKVTDKTHAVEKFPFILKSASSANILQVFFEYTELREDRDPFVVTKTIKLVSPKNEKEFKALNLKEALVITGKDKKQKLKNRVEALMKARIAKDWSKAWGFLDPVYRNLYSKKSWMNTRDRMEFLNYKVLSIGVHGSHGKTKTMITFNITNHVRGVTSEAKHLKGKRKIAEMPWGWFGDNWYLIAEDPRTPYLP